MNEIDQTNPFLCDCGFPLKLDDFACPECDKSPSRELDWSIAKAEKELIEKEPEERIPCQHCGEENFASTLDKRDGECISCGLDAGDDR